MADSKPTTRRRFVHTTAALAATVPAALALPLPSMVAQAAEPDPIFAAIEAHRAALAVCEECTIADDEADGAHNALHDALLNLFETQPTTSAGVAAVLEYASTKPVTYMDNDAGGSVIGEMLTMYPRTGEKFLRVIAETVVQLGAKA
jgi:hypothetical protein